jgi:hypothetical protein
MELTLQLFLFEEYEIFSFYWFLDVVEFEVREVIFHSFWMTDIQ